MKKVTVNENTEIYEFCGSEEGLTYTLYVGVEPVYGEWILTTEGNPVALNDLEEDGSKWAEETIAKIEAIIGDPRTPWKECDESDIEYINDTMEMWGLKE